MRQRLMQAAWYTMVPGAEHEKPYAVVWYFLPDGWVQVTLDGYPGTPFLVMVSATGQWNIHDNILHIAIDHKRQQLENNSASPIEWHIDELADASLVMSHNGDIVRWALDDGRFEAKCWEAKAQGVAKLRAD